MRWGWPANPMIETPAIVVEDSQDEIAALVRTLHETQQRLQELAGGEVDAVVHPTGQSYLLHEAQEKLAHKQAELQMILDAVPAMIFYKDRQHRLVRVNAATLRLHGRPAAELVGMTDAELGLPHARQYVRDEEEIAATGLPKLNIIEPVLTVTGLRWFQTDKVPIRDAAGIVTGFIGISLDITDRKRTELEIRLNEKRYRSLVEATTSMVWDTPPSGELEGEQSSWAAFTGQSQEESRGWGWLQAIHPDDRTETARAWAAAVATRSIYKMEHRLRSRDQTYRNMMVRGVPIFAEDGNILQWIGIHTDITERKQLETQFLRAQRMEGIGTLAGGIAHDLNNVLAPILMAIELLKLDHPGDRNQDILSTLERSCQRAASLVEQVLGFARGVEGQRIVVNPHHLMREWVGIMRDTFPKSITVGFTAVSDLWTVTGDPTQLHQVFLNLCVNARDAMPDGGNLNVSLENLVLDETYAAMNVGSHPGTYVLVQVTDNGSGIPPAIRDQIFDPFFTTKAIGKGTGLGLSTTLTIVKSHGGFINLYSEVGKGTRFKVYLPAQTTETAVQTVAVEQTRLPRGHGEMILLVDDEEPIRKIVQDTLERFGYRVLQARHGAEAVAIYVQYRDDITVVLTDMAMPIMDGPALIIALKGLNPQVKIIGSSGLNANGGVAKAVGAGVQHFVPKPYIAEALLKTLREILGDHGNKPPH